MSVDCTDCVIMEPTPFSPEWYSFKSNGPGLRYEVGISIYYGHIVWINGPFPCGSNPDIKIFSNLLAQRLETNEIVVADSGYNHVKCQKNPEIFGDLSSTIRARHETCNRRFKVFNVLGNRFRHNLNKHSLCFHAVAKIVQLDILSGRPLFHI